MNAHLNIYDSDFTSKNPAIVLFRKKGLPFICIQYMNEANNLVPGEEGFDLPEELDIQPSDLSKHEKNGNAFNKTSLSKELLSLGVDTIIITGFCAEHCVLSTYRGVLDHDLTPSILCGSLVSDNLENIKFDERISNLLSISKSPMLFLGKSKKEYFNSFII